MVNTKCLICGSNELVALAGYEFHDLLKCKTCGFVFMRKIPTKEDLDEHYAKYPYNKDHFLSPVTIAAYNNLLSVFDQYRTTGNILDVGCGRGWLLDVAMEKGWNAFGTEFSNIAIEKCRKKGIKMQAGVLRIDDYEPEQFDVIVLIEVIEHINYPIEELQNIYKLLRKGGLLYITTPNFNSYLRYQLKAKYNIIEYPEHLSYYTKRTLYNVLHQTGFEKIKLEATGISLSRYQASTSDVSPVMDSTSSDEKLRELMHKNSTMKFIKKLANKTLTVSGLGLTLKAYCIK